MFSEHYGQQSHAGLDASSSASEGSCPCAAAATTRLQSFAWLPLSTTSGPAQRDPRTTQYPAVHMIGIQQIKMKTS